MMCVFCHSSLINLVSSSLDVAAGAVFVSLIPSQWTTFDFSGTMFRRRVFAGTEIENDATNYFTF